MVMYMGVYIYIYIYIYMCVYKYINIIIYIYIYIYTQGNPLDGEIPWAPSTARAGSASAGSSCSAADRAA